MNSSYDLRQNIFKRILKKTFSILGFEIRKKNNFNDRYKDLIVDLEEFDEKNIDIAKNLALNKKENLWSIIQSIKHISENNIEGDLVECGVFKGGSLGLMSVYAQKHSLECRIFGYDTFEDGFSFVAHTEYDISYKTKKVAKMESVKNFYPTVSEVKNNLNKFDFKEKYLPILIKGDVLKTLKINENLPEKISFLRLDTDLYKTTKLQLEILYPRLQQGGILHIDDYGLCPGVKKAVDDYFSKSKIWLHRVDLSCRLMIKN